MIIGIGFDGTCVTHEFPKVGRNIGAAPVLRALTNHGHHLCLLTNRSDIVDSGDGKPMDLLITKMAPGNYLRDAIDWFNDNNVPLKYVNFIPEQRAFTSSTRCFCNLYIEWNNLFTPLEKSTSGRPYVNWLQVFVKLMTAGVLDKIPQEEVEPITVAIMDEVLKTIEK